MGMGGLVLPSMFGRVIAAEELNSAIDVALKKQLADAAMNSAKSAGASYCDVRVGRYLRQFVITRERNVENIVNTESSGVGIRVIVNGAWGFAATNALGTADVARAVAEHHERLDQSGYPNALAGGQMSTQGRL